MTSVGLCRRPAVPTLISLLNLQIAEFKQDSDIVLASPAQLGRKPWSDDQVRREFRNDMKAAGVHLDRNQIFGTPSMRNSFRYSLDGGHPLLLQEKLMRHGDIRATLNVYGDVVTDEMAEAQRAKQSH